MNLHLVWVNHPDATLIIAFRGRRYDDPALGGPHRTLTNLKRFGRHIQSGASNTSAFNNAMIKIVTELRPQLDDAPAAIEFGNQTFRAKGGVLAKARRLQPPIDTATH